MTSYVYLHGFASSPASSKAQYFRDRFAERGISLAIPALDDDDFEHLTLTRQLQVLERTIGSNEPVVLLGSSMGGYLAALWAERHAKQVSRVVLLAPAFDFHSRWAERLGPAQMNAWRGAGQIPVFHYGSKQERFLSYQLFEDAAQYAAFPNVTQPALVLQGLTDDVVKPELAREFCRLHQNAELHLYPSGHELTDMLPALWTATERFLFSHE